MNAVEARYLAQMTQTDSSRLFGDSVSDWLIRITPRTHRLANLTSGSVEAGVALVPTLLQRWVALWQRLASVKAHTIAKAKNM